MRIIALTFLGMFLLVAALVWSIDQDIKKHHVRENLRQHGLKYYKDRIWEGSENG